MTATADDRRTRILDAAEQLFAEAGFDATPTARIAELAAVPKGLIFYYFPRKIDLLLTLLEERLPAPPFCDLEGLAGPNDVSGSLLRLHHRLGLDRHESLVMRSIIFRESGTHDEVRHHLRRLRAALVELTESVIADAFTGRLDPLLRLQAAQTFVAVILDHANGRRFGATLPDLAGTTRVITLALQAEQ